MSNVARCDYCGQAFKFHAYSYRRIEMPLIDYSGYFDIQRKVRGGTNTRHVDMCGDCLQAIRQTLEQRREEGGNYVYTRTI